MYGGKYLALLILVGIVAVLANPTSASAVTSCWVYNTSSDCIANLDCNWQSDSWSSNGGWCSEKGCWNFWNQTGCTTSLTTINQTCTWKASQPYSWCSERSCWDFDGTNETACVNNTFSLNCGWNGWCMSTGGAVAAGSVASCWTYSTETSCLNITGCSWGACMTQGCWSWTDQSACTTHNGTSNNACKWNSQWNYCYESSCWDNANQTACTSATGCTWGSWGGCYSKSCYDFSWTNQTACLNNTANLACTWDGTSKACSSEGCWSYSTKNGCENKNLTSSKSCAWKMSGTSGGWCEKSSCWSFDGNQSGCQGASTAGLNCIWEGAGKCGSNMSTGCCYTNVSAATCSTKTGEKSCMDTYYCWWDPNSQTCKDPGSGNFFTTVEFNPGCYIFDNDRPGCGNTTGCTWAGATNKCSGNATIETEGLRCKYLNNSGLCNNMTALSKCCTWQGTTCAENSFDLACKENLVAAPIGATFCEDFSAYDSNTLCVQIAGAPWYMPCKWNNATEHCEFRSEDIFGGESAGFERINNEKNCEFAGGKWIGEPYCSNNTASAVAVPSGRCEYKFDEERNCDRACYACEKKKDGTGWTVLKDVKTACEESKLGFCEFIQDSNAPNSLGFCKPKEAFVTGLVQGNCDIDCGACTYTGNALTGEPQTACANSKANCKWISDPTDSTKGVCMGSGEKSCTEECTKCYTQAGCSEKGGGGNGTCTWDSSTAICQRSSGTDNIEICFDGVDNDADNKIDCMDGGCFSDPFCGGGFMLPGGGVGTVGCSGFIGNTSCIDAGCIWYKDKWNSSRCDVPGANCWELDGNQTGCQARTDCDWSAGNWGYCEMPDATVNQCIGMTQSGCNGNNNCKWHTDQYCADNPTASWCTNSPGWCEFVGFGCWQNNTAATCDVSTYCYWRNDSWSVGGGWCDNKCFNQVLNASTCPATQSGGTNCTWQSGFCNPKGFGATSGPGSGGPATGGTGLACYKHDGNQTQCTNQTGCAWSAESQSFCQIDMSSECSQYSWNYTSCRIRNSTCTWENVTGSTAGEGWCNNKLNSQCHNSTSFSSQTDCERGSTSCMWATNTANDPWCINNPSDAWCTGGHCEPKCYNQTLTASSCNALSGCKWTDGWCNPAMQKEMFKNLEAGAAVPIIIDDCNEAGLNDEADICGFGVKDMGDSFGFGIGVRALKNAAVCNGVKISWSAIGNGKNETNFYWYLDSDGSTSGGCATHNDATKVGYEFFLKYAGKWDNNTGKATETYVTQKCVSGAWKPADVKLTSWKEKMCSDIGGGMVAVDKDDLKKFPSLYNESKDIRIYVATANAAGNSSRPTDTVGPGYYTPGTMDFKMECCWDKKADCDGDNMTAENDPECEKLNKFGFVKQEDCFNNIDDDGNKLVDCSDYACATNSYCVANQLGVNSPTYVDTRAPTTTSVKVEEYTDAALVMYDTDEPSNGTLLFYYNDTACSVLNTTVLDKAISLSGVRDYNTWHLGELYNDGGVASLKYSLSLNTSYYYKVKTCDQTNHCSQSGCMSFRTASNATKCGFCDFVLKLKVPTSWQVSYDANTDGTYEHAQGSVCGPNAGMLLNYTQGRAVNIKLGKTDDSTWFKFYGARVTKSALNDKARTINNASSLLAGTVSTNVGTVGYGGLPSETRDKIVNTLHPDKCQIKIQGKSDQLWHCPDPNTAGVINASQCIDRTSAATLNESGTDYRVWDVPNCEFSTYSGGKPGTSAVSGTTSAAGGGGGTGGAGAPQGSDVAVELSMGAAQTVTLGYADRAVFRLFGEEHSARVESIGADAVTLTVRSTPITLTLSVGETKSLDVDRSGSYDLKIKLNRIETSAQTTVRKVVLTFELLSGGAATKQQAGQQAQEGRKSGAAVSGITREFSSARPELWFAVAFIVVAVVLLYLSSLHRKKSTRAKKFTERSRRY